MLLRFRKFEFRFFCKCSLLVVVVKSKLIEKGVNIEKSSYYHIANKHLYSIVARFCIRIVFEVSYIWISFFLNYSLLVVVLKRKLVEKGVNTKKTAVINIANILSNIHNVKHIQMKSKYTIFSCKRVKKLRL